MPRTQLMERRSFDAQVLDLPVGCPAGERIGETLEGPACRCRIEGSTITSARDGSSLATFCMGEFEVCPTWRLARETEWENGQVSALAAPVGAARNYTAEDLREIEDRRAAGDLAGAAAIRDRIEEARRGQGLRDVSRG